LPESIFEVAAFQMLTEVPAIEYMEQPAAQTKPPPKPKVKKPSAKKDEVPTFRIERGHFVICFK
jgi:hypothetical protein